MSGSLGPFTANADGVVDTTIGPLTDAEDYRLTLFDLDQSIPGEISLDFAAADCRPAPTTTVAAQAVAVQPAFTG